MLGHVLTCRMQVLLILTALQYYLYRNIMSSLPNHSSLRLQCSCRQRKGSWGLPGVRPLSCDAYAEAGLDYTTKILPNLHATVQYRYLLSVVRGVERNLFRISAIILYFALSLSPYLCCFCYYVEVKEEICSRSIASVADPLSALGTLKGFLFYFNEQIYQF